MLHDLAVMGGPEGFVGVFLVAHLAGEGGYEGNDFGFKGKFGNISVSRVPDCADRWIVLKTVVEGLGSVIVGKLNLAEHSLGASSEEDGRELEVQRLGAAVVIDFGDVLVSKDA